MAPDLSYFTRGSSKRRVGATDLDRILALPKRRWQDAEDLDELVELLSAYLRVEGSTWTLRPIQAAALRDLAEQGGLFGPIRVGGGKTLVSLLAARVTKAKRPLIIVPADLKKKTLDELADYRKEWVIPAFNIASYQALGRENNAKELDRLCPDQIFMDECQRIKNLDAAVTKRVARYLKAHPETIVAAVSGTVTQRSIHDYAHILHWTHGPDTSPIPQDEAALQQWADALDEKVPPGRRIHPGELEQLCVSDLERKRFGVDPLTGARRAWARRLTQTPGVVATEDEPLPIRLSLTEVGYTPDTAITEAFTTLRDLWETPDGHTFSDGAEMWRHAREIACGFYYVWDPRAPEAWMDARRNWHSYVRQILAHNQCQLDTELQVRNAVLRGEYDETGEQTLAAWMAIKDTFKPNTKPVWLSDVMINLAADWLANNPGICWVEHTAFGRRLAEVTGLPYFARLGEDAKTRKVIDHHTGPCIASVESCGTGRNLQQFSSNLVISQPGNGGTWEQMIGRTHRDGQEAPEVTFEVVIPCLEQWTGFHQAQLDAKYIQDNTLQCQKLCYADTDVSTAQQVSSRVGPLWNKN